MKVLTITKRMVPCTGIFPLALAVKETPESNWPLCTQNIPLWEAHTLRVRHYKLKRKRIDFVHSQYCNNFIFSRLIEAIKYYDD
jgi:hypothetical protein